MINNSSGEVEFNEALSVIMRLNKLQEELNKSYTNLLALDYFGRYEYDNFINNLDSIYLEISADLTPAEDKEVRAIQDIIRKIKTEIPFKEKKVIHGYEKKEIEVINKERFEIFKGALHEYRRIMNRMKKKHGYSNPEKESSRRAIAG